MRIILYNNYSENFKVKKSIVKIVELQGYLREQTSLINPMILVEFTPENFTGLNYVKEDDNIYVKYENKKILWGSYINDYVLTSNYVYIPDFNRYYFINDIVSIRQNLWRLVLHVDVLMSYRDEILNTNAFVLRNEFEYDRYVKDDLISFYYDKEVNEFEVERGQLVNTEFITNLDLDDHNHNAIINVFNEDVIARDNRTISVPPHLPLVSTASSGFDSTTLSFAIDVTNITNLEIWLGNNSDLASFVNSIIVYPFQITAQNVYNDRTILKLGKIKLENGTLAPYPSVKVWEILNVSPYLVVADFIITDQDFKDYEPYSTYELYLPYLSWITISADLILNNRIIVYYAIDYPTGNAQVNVFDVTNNKLIYTSNTQLGVKIGINTTNAHELRVAQSNANTSLGIGLATSLLSVVGGVVSQNPLLIGGGFMGIGGSIAKYANNQNNMILHATGSITSGSTGMYLPQKVRMRITRMKPKEYNEKFFKLKGRPLNKVKRLGDLSGYTMVDDEHLENFGSSTKGESEEIKSLLSNGVIL